MDQLPEPKFQTDKTWPRMLVGLKEIKEQSDNKYMKTFILLGGLSCFRYVREITFYQKNFLTTAAILPLFVFSSSSLAKSLSYDPYVNAAEINNEKEQQFITKYKALSREIKAKGVEVPNELIY
mmetsp:Transcript_6910/g.7166  ORF Transcript_6910/g.7166 Transcript_6910/m.7166 type:complete len:124 (+) Transcript_6910:18-389(+)